MPDVSHADLHHLLDAIQSALEELRLLEEDNEWFLSDVTDRLLSSEQLIIEKLEESR